MACTIKELQVMHIHKNSLKNMWQVKEQKALRQNQQENCSLKEDNQCSESEGS